MFISDVEANSCTINSAQKVVKHSFGYRPSYNTSRRNMGDFQVIIVLNILLSIQLQPFNKEDSRSPFR